MEDQSTTDIASTSISDAETDISSLPLELHSEILGWLDHWIHLLPASQVCQSWRHLLKPRIRLPSLYQPVHAVLPLEKAPCGYYASQPVIFGTPQPHLPTIWDHSRHALLQNCTIAYRRCPGTSKPQLKVHPGKNIGHLSRDTLTYHPKLTVDEKQNFYDCRYLSLLASPIVIDTRPLAQKTLIWLQIPRLCSTTIYAMMRADGEYLPLGKVLDLILERYRECLELGCICCAKKLSGTAADQCDGEVEDGYDDATEDLGVGDDQGIWNGFGRWKKTEYDDFARRCREFGIIVREDEDMRQVGRIVLIVSPGEAW
ncbi:hypothetical protein TWF696_000437 [Orbilia brochopaga]|uniref:F-box domain-containing protein n=1 Tax=Orbilia brochopaga TaxID=3140254 RepID=A0AAV9VBQ0_9PEZI